MPTLGSLTSRRFALTFPSPSCCSVAQPGTTPRALTPLGSPAAGAERLYEKGHLPISSRELGFVSPGSRTRAGPASPLYQIQQKAAESATVFVPVRVCADHILIHNACIPTTTQCICKRNSAGYSASLTYLYIIQTSITIGLGMALGANWGVPPAAPAPAVGALF